MDQYIERDIRPIAIASSDSNTFSVFKLDNTKYPGVQLDHVQVSVQTAVTLQNSGSGMKLQWIVGSSIYASITIESSGDISTLGTEARQVVALSSDTRNLDLSTNAQEMLLKIVNNDADNPPPLGATYGLKIMSVFKLIKPGV